MCSHVCVLQNIGILTNIFRVKLLQRRTEAPLLFEALTLTLKPSSHADTGITLIVHSFITDLRCNV